MDIRRALIVDDSKLVCFKLSKMLEEKGISSQAVNSGEDALTYLGTNPPPDVVFVDIMMPGMDGYQTVEAIRAQPALAQLPIIMCSSNDTDEDRAKAKQRGANGFLPKPPAPDHLFQTLAGLSTPAIPAPVVPVPVPAPAPVPTPAAHTQPPTPPGVDNNNIPTEVVGRLTREAVKAAEQAVNTRMEDLTHRLALEAEETARRITTTLATETARTVAQRTATEVVGQLAEKNIRQVATQAAGEVARTVVTELVPNLVLERMRALAATTMPAIAEQAIQEAVKRLIPEILQQIAAPATENTLRAAQPKILAESAQLRENLRAELTRELPEKLANAATFFIESDSFRASVTQTVRGIAETVAEKVARPAAEAMTRAMLDQSRVRTASETSPGEQIAREAQRQIEALKSKISRATLALGGGLAVVVLYLVARLFI
ncbi:conserved hypothetical protein [Gammaproteobacteria bacterium]